jgi:hypothetical protein
MKLTVLKNLCMLSFLGSTSLYACEYYVIGFRGAGGAFDSQAFYNYTGNNCSKLYNANQTTNAVNFIKTINAPYELYGFSLGAQSVKTVLKTVDIKPEFILTIGAFHTANVNFDKYGIKYKNYFDESGKRQKSPGIHVPGVPHMKLQEYVNKDLLK